MGTDERVASQGRLAQGVPPLRHQINVKLPERLIEDARTRATATGQTLTAIVQTALEQTLYETTSSEDRLDALEARVTRMEEMAGGF